MDILVLLLIIGIAVIGYSQIRCLSALNKQHRRVVRLEKRLLQSELAKDAKQSDKDDNNEYWQKIADFLNDK